MDRHPQLRDFFRVTALATDRDGGVYVANLEAKDYPITATQWHPVRPCLRPTCVRLAHCVRAYPLASAPVQGVAEPHSWPTMAPVHGHPFGCFCTANEVAPGGTASRLCNVMLLCLRNS